jgi:hypothetical protein
MKAIRALMTCDELGQLARMKGIEIGGHTVNHPILARASAYDQRWEIEQNLATSSNGQGNGLAPSAFQRPAGYRLQRGHAGDSSRRRRRHMAFTTRPSFAQSDEQPLERSRFFLLSDTSDAELAHRLAYSWSSDDPEPTLPKRRRITVVTAGHISACPRMLKAGRPDERRLSCSPRFGQPGRAVDDGHRRCDQRPTPLDAVRRRLLAGDCARTATEDRRKFRIDADARDDDREFEARTDGRRDPRV